MVYMEHSSQRGTTSIKVSVGYDKEEALDCSLVATTRINIQNGGSGRYISYVIAWKKLLYSGGTIAFKVSVGCDKEEVLVYII